MNDKKRATRARPRTPRRPLEPADLAFDIGAFGKMWLTQTEGETADV